MSGAESQCEACSVSFEQTRAGARFCKGKECGLARQKARWVKWQMTQTPEQYREKANAIQRKYRSRTGYDRRWELQKKYGITLEDWLAMLEAVDNKCELCGDAGTEALCVDHDHVSGKVRGVLCRSCNRAIGQLGDNCEALWRAATYLCERMNRE